MNRIEVSSSSTGPSDYTLPINPFTYDPVDEANIAENSVLHGPAVYQENYSDNRIRTLTWDSFEVSDTDIRSIVQYFRSIEGEIRYFNFKDLDNINERWITDDLDDADWKKARVITLKTKPMPGGKLRYEYVQILLQPEY